MQKHLSTHDIIFDQKMGASSHVLHPIIPILGRHPTKKIPQCSRVMGVSSSAGPVQIISQALQYADRESQQTIINPTILYIYIILYDQY